MNMGSDMRLCNAGQKLSEMANEVIKGHDLLNILAGYCSDTPTVMRSVWAILGAEYPRLIFVGCMDHCLDLFLKDARALSEVCLPPFTALSFESDR